MQTTGGLRETSMELVFPCVRFTSEGNSQQRDESAHQISLQMVVQRTFLGTAHWATSKIFCHLYGGGKDYKLEYPMEQFSGTQLQELLQRTGLRIR